MPKNGLISLQFDGGVRTSEKVGYGSYRLGEEPIIRVSHGSGVTSNQAEYLTLISALSHLHEALNPSVTDLRIQTDSMLVVQQVKRRWRANDSHLIVLRNRVRAYLDEYMHWELSWVPRAEIVKIFGH